MSIVNESEERIFPEPKPRLSRPVKSGRIRARNWRWLEMRRSLNLSVRALAELVKEPASTVAAGILWAQEEEEIAEELAVLAEQSPIVEPISGLTAVDVVYLCDTYPLGTELGDNPLVQRLLRDLYARVLNLYPELAKPTDFRLAKAA